MKFTSCEAYFWQTVRKFFLRLRNRGYPRKFLRKLFQEINFEKRHSLLFPSILPVLPAQTTDNSLLMGCPADTCPAIIPPNGDSILGDINLGRPPASNTFSSNTGNKLFYKVTSSAVVKSLNIDQILKECFIDHVNRKNNIHFRSVFSNFQPMICTLNQPNLGKLITKTKL